MPEFDSTPGGISVHKRRAAARTLRPAAAGSHQHGRNVLLRTWSKKTGLSENAPFDRRSRTNKTRENNDAAMKFVQPYATARMTRATFSKISPISASLAIRGGAIASVSPVMRMTKSSSWNARSIAS